MNFNIESVRSYIVVLCLLLLANELNAQTPLLVSKRNAIYGSFGIDPSFVTTLGYVREFKVRASNRNLMLSSDISVPVQFDLQDYRLKFGGHINILNHHKLQCWGTLSVIDTQTKNSIHKANNLGTEIIILTGLFGKQYFISGELCFERSFLTYMKHSDWYKTNLYSEAKDGWYRSSISHFRYGIRLGFSLFRFEMTLRAGVDRTKSMIDPLMPFYGVFGLNYRI